MLARTWLYLGMGLGGILTVALIVSADQSYAGMDGMRSVRAILAGPAAAVTVPGPVPTTAATPPAGRPTPSAAPAAIPPQPVAARIPAAQPAAASATPAATPAATPIAGPSLPPAAPTPGPSMPPAPSAPPAATPAPTAPPAGPATPPSSTPNPTSGLAITTDRGATALIDLAGLVPGDSITRSLTVRNSGTLDLRYTIGATQSAATLLWTDPADGLQLSVATLSGTVLYSGPIGGLGTLAGPSLLSAGASETLRYTVTFPASAPNAFQGLIQDLTLVYTATQYP